MRRAELHDGRNLLFLQFQAMYHCTSEREGTAELTALASASATTLNHCNKLGASPLSIAVKTEGLLWAVPILLRCAGQALVLQSVDKADLFTPLGYAIAHGLWQLTEMLWAACRSYKVNTVRALIGPQKQRITEDIRQPLFLAAARRHWFAHAWLQDDVAHELQTVYLQAGLADPAARQLAV